jgi:hypothetical protein
MSNVFPEHLFQVSDQHRRPFESEYHLSSRLEISFTIYE